MAPPQPVVRELHQELPGAQRAPCQGQGFDHLLSMGDDRVLSFFYCPHARYKDNPDLDSDRGLRAPPHHQNLEE